MVNYDEDLQTLVKYSKPVILNQQLLNKNKDTKHGIDPTESNTEDILNSILPPREYTVDKKYFYIENVLSTPATIEDVLQLGRDLDSKLKSK